MTEGAPQSPLHWAHRPSLEVPALQHSYFARATALKRTIAMAVASAAPTVAIGVTISITASMGAGAVAASRLLSRGAHVRLRGPCRRQMGR